MADAPDFIPDSEFTPDQAPQQQPSTVVKQAQPTQDQAAPDFIPDSQFVPDTEKYGTPEQTAKAAIEAAASSATFGLSGGLERALGVNPEGIRGRAAALEDQHPLGAAAAKAAGFVGSMLIPGVGEAELAGKLGQAAVEATGLAESANLAGRMAASGVKVGTEIAAMNAGDENFKFLTGDPDQTVGSAIANTAKGGLTGLIAGPVFTGVGAAGKAGLDALGIGNVFDRLAQRASGFNPKEAIKNNLEQTINQYAEMGSEVGGADGLKAQGVEKLMPKMSDKIGSSAIDTLYNLDSIAKEMEARPFQYGTRVPGLMREGLLDFQKSIGEGSDPSKIWDGLNSLKKVFDSNIPDNLADNEYAQSYRKLMDATGIIRKGLENTDTWGELGQFQKDINKAWSSIIGPMKDIRQTFMSKVNGKYIVDQAKINTFENTANRAEQETIRQTKMKNFVNGMEKFYNGVDAAHVAADVPNTFPPPAMSALMESVGKKPMSTKIADALFDRLGASAIGNLTGAVAGNAIAPGFGGAFIGKEVLGPTFSAIAKPVLDNVSRISVAGYRAAKELGDSALQGQKQLSKISSELFSGALKTIPQNYTSDDKDLKNLDEKVDEFSQNPKGLMNVAGSVGHYAPDHASALAKTAATAVTYLSSQKPRPIQASPLDTKFEPTKDQMNQYNRKLAIANNPNSIIQHIKNGTLLPQDMKTLTTIYPGYYNKISQALMNAMTDHLSKDGEIPYRMRQSLSLFLGHAVDSTLTPQSIMAAQAVYVAKTPPPGNPPVAKNKKNTSKLGKISENMFTQTQSAEQRRLGGE